MSRSLDRREFLKSSAAIAAGTVLGGVASPPTRAQTTAGGTQRGASDIISTPKGGGAIRGIGETFQPNLFTGTGNFSIPIATSPGREGVGPQLTLQYSTGNGNGPFGLGWQLSIPRISRKTEKGLPSYSDDDVFVMSGAEDLVPLTEEVPNSPGKWRPKTQTISGHTVTRYRPRTEGLFARIEQWVRLTADGLRDVHWRATAKDNITSIYGRSPSARVTDPQSAGRVFEWLLEETFDVKGNHIFYEYIQEPADASQLSLPALHNKNRRFAQAYIRRILYGNVPETLAPSKSALLPEREGTEHSGITSITPKSRSYVFEVLFDYGDLPDPLTAYEGNGYEQGRKPWWDKNNDDIAKLPCRRDDVFSSHRAGFEILTLRRCERVLMLHHFPEDELVGAPLVRSTNFAYGTEAHAGFSLLQEVSVVGYRRDPADRIKYLARSMPPVTFAYSSFEPGRQRYQSVRAEGDDYPPGALDRPGYALMDVFGDALPDVVNGTSGAYFYWQNLGEANLDRRRLMPTMPAGVALSDSRVAIGDMGGDGLADLIVDAPPMSGFFEATPDGRWARFKRFNRMPSFDLSDPNVRLVDLTGDGLSDVLVTRDDHFLWYRCAGESGYEDQIAKIRRHDLDEFPDVYFSDPAGRVRLADMTGDGLSDIVLVHDGRIEYWPNQGYCNWGRRVVMKHAPRVGFRFDPKRLFLVDLDGTGCADVVYVDFDRVHFWFNKSGSGFSQQHTIEGTPYTVDTTSLQFADFFGTGTACLVWSYDYNRQPGGNYKVLDFCGGKKPHLLVEMSNNLGATTRVQYAPSTKFYLEDKKKGQPWVTNLPFPVQVLEKTEVIDHIGKTKLVTRYKYHHGYYDGREREFRGFGRVDKIDTETFDQFSKRGLHGEATFTNADIAFHVPPVLTRNWFHTGIYFDQDRHINHGELTQKYQQEYCSLLQEVALSPHDVELGSRPHEAWRPLLGALLRSEVYGLDGERTEDKPGVPYTVAETRYQVQTLQAPRQAAKPGKEYHGVYLTTAIETLKYHYERNPLDPRVTHELTLEVDGFGNVLKRASIGYGRRLSSLPTQWDRERQTTALLTYTENGVTNSIDSAAAYRNPLPCDTRTYELTGYAATGAGGRYQASDFIEQDPSQPNRLRHKLKDEVPYEAPASSNPCRRLIEWARTLYRHDDLTGLLPLCQLHPRGLPGETYKLAFTPGLLAKAFLRPRLGTSAEPLLPDPTAVLGGQAGNQGGYVQSQTLKADGRFPASDADDHWWQPSGRSHFTDKAEPAAEFDHARKHFFLPRRYSDAFDQDAFVDFDAYDLLGVETRDALGNRVTVDVNDYRVLQPRLVSDPNRNRTEVAFDTLGMVVGTAVMGKPPPALPEGDSLGGLIGDVTQTQLDQFMSEPRKAVPNARESVAARIVRDLLGNATTRIVYDLHRFMRLGEPPVAATIVRVTHVSDLKQNETSKLQVSFSYSDGFGRQIQQKMQAEMGNVPQRDARGKIIVGPEGQPVNPRWVGGGWTIFNNKGKPVRQFEPFFTDTHKPDLDAKIGVSSVLFYDPAGRVIVTLHPNRTYEKVVFDPWQQTSYDVNDTCAPRPAPLGDTRMLQTGDPRTDPDIGSYVAKYFKTQPADWQTWHAQRIGGALGQGELNAAKRAAAHANTPTTAHFDALGRPFLTVARNRVVCAGHDLDGTEDSYATRVGLDIEGNERSVRDAVKRSEARDAVGNPIVVDDPLGRVVMLYAYDMLGNRLHQLNMEAGARWTLNDVAGKPIRAWDNRGHDFTTTYDALRRPERQYVRGTINDSDPRTLNRDILLDKIEYGESLGNADALNLRTRIYRHFDSAGVATNARLDANGSPLEAYDFKGNLLRSTRRLARDYKAIADWLLPAEPQLEAEFFEGSTRYDALNRPVQSVAPHSSLTRPEHPNKFNVIQAVFNEANSLERVDVWLERPSEPATLLDSTVDAPSPVGVTNIDYDAKGQRERIEYKNGASTSYSYDPLTFRLAQLVTRRNAAAFPGDDPQPAWAGCPGRQVQNLHYTYDPAGNITHIRDDAQQKTYFKNKCVEPSNDYTYDALYRLIQAKGREHLGQGGTPIPHSHNDADRVGLQQPGDGNAMGTYIERYVYDAVGNLLRMHHGGSDPAHAGWTRAYDYVDPSWIEDGIGGAPLKINNRLSRTTLNPAGNTQQPEAYLHDTHGNMLRMPHLGGGRPGPNTHWGYKDQLRQTDLGGGGMAFYVYDASGQRVRKVWEKAPGLTEERIYLGGFEIFRRHGGPIGVNTARLERETLHVMDDKQRIALVETRTLDMAGDDQAARQLIRYQFGNHLGSAALELDEQVQIISYEEYAPYGSSTYQAVRSQTETAKRYRYTGKERDEESGLYYHGARYYAAWLGRWASADPDVSAHDKYVGMGNNPIRFVDPTGEKPEARVSGTFFVRGTLGTQDTFLATGLQISGAVADDWWSAEAGGKLLFSNSHMKSGIVVGDSGAHRGGVEMGWNINVNVGSNRSFLGLRSGSVSPLFGERERSLSAGIGIGQEKLLYPMALSEFNNTLGTFEISASKGSVRTAAQWKNDVWMPPILLGGNADKGLTNVLEFRADFRLGKAVVSAGGRQDMFTPVPDDPVKGFASPERLAGLTHPLLNTPVRGSEHGVYDTVGDFPNLYHGNTYGFVGYSDSKLQMQLKLGVDSATLGAWAQDSAHQKAPDWITSKSPFFRWPTWQPAKFYAEASVSGGVRATKELGGERP